MFLTSRLLMTALVASPLAAGAQSLEQKLGRPEQAVAKMIAPVDTSPDPCGLMAAAQARPRPVNLQEAQAQWGPLLSLAGTWWLLLDSEASGGTSMLHRYEWLQEGRVLRRVQRYSIGPQETTTFAPAAEPGVWDACAYSGILRKHYQKVYRLTSPNTVTSDWWSVSVGMFNSVTGREEIKAPANGGYEQRAVANSNGSKPPFAGATSFVPYSDEQLQAVAGKFGAEKAAYNENLIRTIEEDAKRRKEESAAFWDGVAHGAVAVTQGVSQAYAEQQASRPSGPTAAQRELAAIQERERLGNQQRPQGAQATTPFQQTRLQQPTPQVVAQTAPRTQAVVAASDSGTGAARQAVLTILFQVPLEFRKGDTSNSNCLVLVSAPGPAGFLESNDLSQVRAIADSYKPRVLQQCSTVGRRVAGNADNWNADDSPSKLGQARAMYDRAAGQNAQYRFEIQ